MTFEQEKPPSILSRVIVFLSVPIIVGIFTFMYLRSAFLSPVDSNDRSTVLVEVAPTKTSRDISNMLKEKGLVKSVWPMVLLARLNGYDTKFRAGEFEISKSMNVIEILQKLISNQVFKRKVLIREGMSVWQVGEIVELAGLLPRLDFESALTNKDLLRKAGITGDSFEGYLFPETYNFSRPITPEDIIWTTMQEGEKRWPEEFTERADQLKLSRHDVITLASIIEKESGNVEEQPLVSSVFHNRLKQNMPLQSDPTVAYGLQKYSQPPTADDLDISTPYNTYLNKGLPPGPICNPGETAIRAALFPPETAYLYFVSDGTGAHIFSTNLAEHNSAVARYRETRKLQKANSASQDAQIPEDQVIVEPTAPPANVR